MSGVIFDVGDVLDGRYHLLRDLGRGAVGTVFEARHLFTGRFVAVKMVMPEPHGSTLSMLRTRLQREAQALATIRHPGVVDVLDGGITSDGQPYIVMEKLEGRTLEGLLTARNRLSVATSCAVALQLCDALDAVHGVGVVHRDVKPSNVIVLKDAQGRETVKLIDFGIARVVFEEKLTARGAVVGTPAYMAPELLLDDGVEADAQTDLYAVGVTLFECLSGLMPYPGNLAQIVLNVAYDRPSASLAAAAPDVPAPLVAVVDRAIAKRREDRFGTIRDLARALEGVAGPSRRTALLGPPPSPTAEQMAEQRRRFARAPYNTPVRLVLPNGVQIDGRTEDISERGAFILSFADCVPAQVLSVRFALPLEGRVVSLEARVRWVRASERPGSNGMRAIGLEFVDPPQAVATSIKNYVALMLEPQDDAPPALPGEVNAR